MSGPFGQLSDRRRGRAIRLLAAAAVAQLALFVPLERRMKRTGGHGIIPFELAGSPERSRQILETWGGEGQAAARVSLALDYPFPATYAPLQALACTAAGQSLAAAGHRSLASLAGPLAWTQLAAALFDYAENTSLLAILAGRGGSLPQIARRAALTKFAFLYTGWGYMLLARASAMHGR